MKNGLYLVTIITFLLMAGVVFAQTSLVEANTENGVVIAEEPLIDIDSGDYASVTLVMFLAGAFCALWAQNSGRNPWLWFFLGMLFNFLTVLIMLMKNSSDLDHKPSPG